MAVPAEAGAAEARQVYGFRRGGQRAASGIRCGAFSMSADGGRRTWSADVAAGFGSGLAYIPLLPVVAFLAFGALGPQMASSMTAVVFAANVLGGLVVLLLARSPLAGGVTSGTCAIAMAGLFASLARHGAVPDVAQVMAITLCTVATVGIVQIVLVWLGAAALGPLTPYPVIAGLVNGCASSASRRYFLAYFPKPTRC